MSSESNYPDPAAGPAAAPVEEPFAGLSPDAILNAIDSVLDACGPPEGVRTSGQVLALTATRTAFFRSASNR